MEWNDLYEKNPLDNSFVNIKFPNGNIKLAQYKKHSYPRESFWLECGTFFICKEKVREWSDRCLKCQEQLDPIGECVVCVHLN